MKCVFLTAPGEVVEAAQYASRRGYEVELYPVTQDTSTLTDRRAADAAAYIGRSPESAERPHVRSLRASFIRMLRDERYRGDDSILFCESDAVPLLPAPEMRELLQQARTEHPDADIIRPFRSCEWRLGLPDAEIELPPENLSFTRMERHPERDVCTAEFWGTHALLIPTRSREKVAQAFAEYRLPTDVTLSLANGRDELEIIVSSHNLFYQVQRTLRPRTFRIAGMLSSYKRFKDLQRQIWCMMDQDIENFHLFVAAKGISEADFRRILKPQFRHFEEEGRLTLRLFPNRNQLTNLLDTVRGLDISGFDLFAKIDDDDIYSRDYFSLIHRFHSMLPPNIGSHYSGCGGYFWSAKGFPAVARGGFGMYGPTIVVPPRVLELLQGYEKNPESILPHFPAEDHGYLRSCFGLREDALLDFINRRMGACNRATCTDVEEKSLSLLICQDNPSVLRGHYIEDDLGCNMHRTSPQAQTDEHLLFLCHPHWSAPLRLLGDRAARLDVEDQAQVLSFDGEHLTLRWDHWGEEQYLRDDTGCFRLKETAPDTGAEERRPR